MINMTSESQQIGSRLSVCRQNKNMTQEELAYRLGVTPQALSKWERGMSLPDTSILPSIARMLEISTDYLLGINQQNTMGGDGCKLQRMIGENLRNTLEPLELIFGVELFPLFTDQNYTDEIKELRLRLSREGFLLPVFRIRDELRLESREFMILSYGNVLYSEQLAYTDDKCMGEDPLRHIIERLGSCIREKYYEILYPDLLKGLVDNLKIKYPVLIEGVIPEKISYGLLTDMVKRLLRRGCSIACLPKIIEGMECLLEGGRDVSGRAAEDTLAGELLRDGNIKRILEERSAPAQPDRLPPQA